MQPAAPCSENGQSCTVRCALCGLIHVALVSRTCNTQSGGRHASLLLHERQNGADSGPMWDRFWNGSHHKGARNRWSSVPMSEAAGPLLLAPLPALAAVVFDFQVMRGASSPTFLVLLPFVAAVCYAAELFGVLPFFLLWPGFRRPSATVAALWGLSLAWVTLAVIVGLDLTKSIDRAAALLLSLSGAASGLMYVLSLRCLRPR